MKNNVEDYKIKRIEWLDFIRSIAIIMVVLCHSVEVVYPMSLDGMNMPITSKIFCFSAFTIGRLGVPIFLLLSGYLLLDREYDTKDRIIDFWKRKLIPLIIAFEGWTILMDIISCFSGGKDFDIVVLLKKMTFLQASEYSHMWYMPMIISLYLMIPFVSIVVRKVSVKILMIPLSIYFIYYFIIPQINIICHVNNVAGIYNNTYIDFIGSYGCYLLVGFMLKHIFENYKWKQNIKIKCVLYVVAIISFVITVVLQLWCYENNVQYNVWYDSGTLFVCGVSIFAIVGMDNRKYRCAGIWNKISEASFGIYVIHGIALGMIVKIPMICALERRTIKVVVVLVVTFIASFITERVLSMFPHISQYLLLSKKKRGTVDWLKKKEE